MYMLRGEEKLMRKEMHKIFYFSSKKHNSEVPFDSNKMYVLISMHVSSVHDVNIAPDAMLDK